MAAPPLRLQSHASPRDDDPIVSPSKRSVDNDSPSPSQQHPPSILPHSAFFSPATKRRTYTPALTTSNPNSVSDPSAPVSAWAHSPISPAPPLHQQEATISTANGSVTSRALNGMDTRSREPLLDPHSAMQDRPVALQPQSGEEKSPDSSAPRPGHVATGKRNYTQHAGSNRFFLCGLVMTADANPSYFLLSLFILVALGGLWLGFEASYQWHHLSPAVVIVFAYLWAGTIVHMLVTAWRDPGVVPRDLDPEPLTAQRHDKAGGAATATNLLDPEDPIRVPMPRIVRVRNDRDLTVKWCETCRLYRPPRSSHCRVCDNCVDGIGTYRGGLQTRARSLITLLSADFLLPRAPIQTITVPFSTRALGDATILPFSPSCTTPLQPAFSAWCSVLFTFTGSLCQQARFCRRERVAVEGTSKVH